MTEPRSPRGRAFPDSLLAVRSLLSAGGRWTRVLARRNGLSDSELQALEHLAPGPIGPADLSRRLGITTAAATGVVDRLVDRGHAERLPDASDRRRIAVRITDSGYVDLRAQLGATFDALLAWDATFSDAERDVVTRYLDGVVRALEAASTAEARGRARD